MSGRLTVGTASLLFGVHQCVWHPFTVWRAWRALYGAPTWRELVCIVIHDWGYWGCRTMDGPDGMGHPFAAARLAGWLFGIEHYQLVLDHSRHLAKALGRTPSRLCWADKFSMLYDPPAFYLWRARCSGELAEYRANAAARGFIASAASDRAWLDKLRNHLAEMARAHADGEGVQS